jgi:ATP adenylyltransferase/5',5'''-P-1,P-4-tetraphosphate phosphorylase II
MAQVSSQQVNEFITSQLAEWQQAADNYAALKNVSVRELDVDGMTIRIQFNPARIVSSAAKVDKAAIKERKCFLCSVNRPAQQRGIEWGKYTILINPFPIFPRHLTIPDNSHVDQLIKGRITDMMQLATQLDEYTIFYNGPKCGASAPDHQHFQAGNSDFLPLADYIESCDLQTIISDGESTLSLAEDKPLKVFVIDAETPDKGQALFDKLYQAMPVKEDETEPMMNLLCYATPIGTRLVVIPRKRHRPSFYGTEGEGSMLISPASVDLGGVLITPLEKDFNKIDKDIILKIFDELCLSSDEMRDIANNII